MTEISDIPADVWAKVNSHTINGLKVTDRCDKRDCGVQAFVKVTMPSDGAELLFCVHHYVDAQPKLITIQGAVIDDYSASLDPKVEEAARRLGV